MLQIYFIFQVFFQFYCSSCACRTMFQKFMSQTNWHLWICTNLFLYLMKELEVAKINKNELIIMFLNITEIILKINKNAPKIWNVCDFCWISKNMFYNSIVLNSLWIFGHTQERHDKDWGRGPSRKIRELSAANWPWRLCYIAEGRRHDMGSRAT